MNRCHVRMILAGFTLPVPDRGCEEMCQQADCSTLRITLLTTTAYVYRPNDARRGSGQAGNCFWKENFKKWMDGSVYEKKTTKAGNHNLKRLGKM